MEEEKRSTVSFGFSKIKESKTILQNRDVVDDQAAELDLERKDYLTSIDDKKLKGTKAEEEKTELVIPLIETNRWRRPQQPEDLEKDDVERDGQQQTDRSRVPAQVTAARSGDIVTDNAVLEILQETERQKEEWENRGITDTGIAIPLLLRNKVPAGYEEEDQPLDVSLRPDEAEEADYEQVPIEEYGMAMLRGMGWNKGQGIGKAGKSFKPIDAMPRPKGLGLGADKSTSLQSQTVMNGESKKDEDLILKKGAHCIVESGKHSGLYATIDGLDEDNARAVVTLALTSEKVTLSQYAIKLVSKKDFKKYSKYLNKSKVDEYKEQEEQRSADSESDSNRHRHKHKHKKDRHRETEQRHSTDRENKHRKDSDKDRHSKHRDILDRDGHRDRYSEDRDSDYNSKSDRHKHKHHKHERHSEERSERKRKQMRSESPERDHRERSRSREREKESEKKRKKHQKHSSSNDMADGSSSARLWLKPNLRVRIIDPEYKRGKYFKEKVIIEDVTTPETCVCKIGDGKVLEDIRSSMLETVIPKSDPAYVCVISGKYRGQLGEILRRDKSKLEASVQLLSDRDVVLSLDYDSICEYTGDIDMEFDY